MFVEFPKIPEVKDGQINADELYRYIYNLQLIIKKLAEKVNG